MSISRLYIGDSNVRRFWSNALADRCELASKMEYLPANNIKELKLAVSKVSPSHTSVVISALTNPISEHLSSVAPQSVGNLKNSTETVLVELLTKLIYPFCKGSPETKVVLIRHAVVALS